MGTTLIRNGTIITAGDRYQADIYIDKGIITLIGQGLTLPADTVLDASGKLVMPGGIDVPPTSTCPSAAPPAPTTSRPARGPRPMAGPPP